MSTEKGLKEHEATHIINMVNCDVCAQEFGCPKDLEAHMGTHAGSSSFSCPICSYKSKSVEEVEVHNTNIVRGLEESCRKLEEQIDVERKCNEENISLIKELEEKVKSLSKEVEDSKEMISNEIRKNEEKQEKIETLEEIVKTHNDGRNQNDSDTKIALECAKDVILEYKAQVTRLTKEKDIEVGKIMVE